MQDQDLTDAINDSSRPLSVPPEQWMQRRGSIKHNDNIVTAKVAGEMSGLEQVDMGVDSIIKGIGMIGEGLKQLETMQMDSSDKEALRKVKDIVDTAIAPYTADMVEQLDGLEGE